MMLLQYIRSGDLRSCLALCVLWARHSGLAYSGLAFRQQAAATLVLNLGTQCLAAELCRRAWLRGPARLVVLGQPHVREQATALLMASIALS